MASIWIQEPGHPARKLETRLTLNEVVGVFKEKVNRLAKKNGATIERLTELEAELRLPPKEVGDVLVMGPLFALWVEMASPPTAPEVGQPKLAGGRGVLIKTDGAVVDLGIPS